VQILGRMIDPKEHGFGLGAPGLVVQNSGDDLEDI
jgi:hypothetical protein